jgi:hypothetical protein
LMIIIFRQSDKAAGAVKQRPREWCERTTESKDEQYACNGRFFLYVFNSKPFPQYRFNFLVWHG